MTEVRSSEQTPIRSRVRVLIRGAWRSAVDSGALPELEAGAEEPAIEVARPARPEHGDLSVNLALKLARPLRRSPLAIAEALAVSLRKLDGLEGTGTAPGSLLADVTVAAPGFVNLRLAPAAVERGLDEVRDAPDRFGTVRSPGARTINVEFVSANPTGPLTIGNARGAFVGDLLSRVLEAAGNRVTREYYFNDFNAQVLHLGESVRAVRLSEPIPADGYHGAYVGELAEAVPETVWAEALAGDDPDAAIGKWASERVRAGIEASLERLGVRFDVWKTESSLHAEGWVERAVERLRKGGHLYEQDGALWFRSTTFGDDKDRVVYRSDGRPTYFAADIGYVTEKFSRGFDHLVYVWGEDHHGTVARNHNAAGAMGYPRDAVQMLLIAWVRFVREGREISMSKRSGEFITLDELLTEVGVDAARWFFASRSHTTGIDFDIELAKKESAENPVYYVQYAHARICSILRRARDAGLLPSDSVVGSLGEDPIALTLGREVLRLPEVIEDAATAMEIQGITAYATEVATLLHTFYRDRRVIDEQDPELSAQRLALIDAVRISLARTLASLGISAPEVM